MRNVQKLRTIVSNGWTIETRKNIIQTFGKQRSVKLSKLANKANFGMDMFVYSNIDKYLKKDIFEPLSKVLSLFKKNTPTDNIVFDSPESYCINHKYRSGFMALENYPKNYVQKRSSKKSTIYPYYTLIVKPFYYINRLFSSHKGDGTMAIQSVLLKSLRDKQTNGRIILECAKIDDSRPCAAGFYYKLGFRFLDKKLNKPLQEWLKKGGKRENMPQIYGDMYLPKRNIEKCISYKSK